MASIELGKLFTEADLIKAAKIVAKSEVHLAAKELVEKVVKPRMADIDRVTGQANDPTYMGYLLYAAVTGALTGSAS